MSTALRILLVDDDELLTELVAHVLESVGGYEVHVENRPEQALTHAKAFAPNLILLDRSMPTMSGDQVFSALREDRQTAPTPVAFFSGQNTATSFDSDGTWHVPKPIGMMALLGTVRCILN
jgi:CheY-like chemotaxis protein